MTGIYLDNNASTPMLPEVWEAMLPYYSEKSANPASSHRSGQLARRALDDARERTAALLGAFADEVLFTSGATEANNLAIFGLVQRSQPAHVVSSSIEHPCVSEPLKHLTSSGFQVELAPVEASGVINPVHLQQILRAETRLAAVMLANHETGAVQPIMDAVEAVRLRSPQCRFHCDAAAAVGKMPVSFHELGPSTMTVSAHKFHGPKGVGVLLVKRGVQLHPMVWGGHQQQGRRPGTEPVALVVGLAVALELACQEMNARREKVMALRQRFLQQLRESTAPIVVNGPEHDGVPHTLNISFPGCKADALLMSLDLAGIACSTGSACSSGSLLPSPVLRAMQVADDVLHSAMRFSFSHLLELDDMDEAARRIHAVVARLRKPADQE